MFEIDVEDFFTVTGLGSVFVGKIRSGSISVGDSFLCRAPSAEVRSRVASLQDPRTNQIIKSAEAGSEVAVTCKKINPSSLAGAFEGEGEDRRIVGLTLVSVSDSKPWWQFW